MKKWHGLAGAQGLDGVRQSLMDGEVFGLYAIKKIAYCAITARAKAIFYL
jgi:hypothetical protein